MPFPLLALAIPAAIRGITSLIGGKKAATAAKDAATVQAKAAQRAADEARRVSGEVASDVRSTAGEAAGDVRSTAAGASGDVINAGNLAAAGVDTATAQGQKALDDVYKQAMGLTQPYREAGTTAVGGLQDLAAGPDFTFNEDDPSYQFRLQEGLKALQRNKAVRGMLTSGSALKGITNYAGGAASQEYQAAFDRFQQNRNYRTSVLGALAGYGLTGTGQALQAGSEYGGRTADLLQTGARTAGAFRVGGETDAANFRLRGEEVASGYRVNAENAAAGYRLTGTGMAQDAELGRANATAAGKVGAASAWNQTLTNVGTTVANVIPNYYAINSLTSNPAATPPPPAQTPPPNLRYW